MEFLLAQITTLDQKNQSLENENAHLKKKVEKMTLMELQVQQLRRQLESFERIEQHRQHLQGGGPLGWGIGQSAGQAAGEKHDDGRTQQQQRSHSLDRAQHHRHFHQEQHHRQNEQHRKIPPISHCLLEENLSFDSSQPQTPRSHSSEPFLESLSSHTHSMGDQSITGNQPPKSQPSFHSEQYIHSHRSQPSQVAIHSNPSRDTQKSYSSCQILQSLDSYPSQILDRRSDGASGHHQRRDYDEHTLRTQHTDEGNDDPKEEQKLYNEWDEDVGFSLDDFLVDDNSCRTGSTATGTASVTASVSDSARVSVSASASASAYSSWPPAIVNSKQLGTSSHRGHTGVGENSELEDNNNGLDTVGKEVLTKQKSPTSQQLKPSSYAYNNDGVTFPLGRNKRNRYIQDDDGKDDHQGHDDQSCCNVFQCWQDSMKAMSTFISNTNAAHTSNKAKTAYNATSAIPGKRKAFDKFLLFSVNQNAILQSNTMGNDNVSNHIHPPPTTIDEIIAVEQMEFGSKLWDEGKTFLDPFVLKTAQCVDQYPFPAPMAQMATRARNATHAALMSTQNYNLNYRNHRHQNNPFDPNDPCQVPPEISKFCCPNGIQIRILPKGSISAAEKLGWVGSKGDSFQILEFTDVNSRMLCRRYGIAITTHEIIDDSQQPQQRGNSVKNTKINESRAGKNSTNDLNKNLIGGRSFVAQIKHRRAQRLALRKIVRWWKYISEYRKKWQCAQGTPFKTLTNLDTIATMGDVGTITSVPTKLPGTSSFQEKGRRMMFDLQSLNSVRSSGLNGLKSMFRSNIKMDDCRSQSSADGLVPNIRQGAANNDFDTVGSTSDFGDVGTVGDDAEDIGDDYGNFLDWEGNTHKEKRVVLDCHGWDNAGNDDNGTQNSHGWDDQTKKASNRSPISEKVQMLGRQTYWAMKEVEKEGEVCIVEKRYVLMGGVEGELFLQMKLLYELILREKEGKANADKQDKSDNKKGNNWKMKLPGYILKFQGTDSRKSTVHDFRHEYLKILHEGMFLSPHQVQVRIPRSRNMSAQHTQLHQTSPSFCIDLPTTLFQTAPFSMPLPLPNIGGHWGVAALVSRLKPADLLIVLQLMLVERSVLVLGESSHLVTACTFGLLKLLKPFSWASTFISLLPDTMLDFVHSSVPFVIGMVVKDFDHMTEIETDARVRDAMSSGLTVVNLTTKIVHLTRDPQVLPLLKGCPTPRLELTMYQRKVALLRKQDPALRSFARFVVEGLSFQEMKTIDSICNLIKNFFTGLSDNISSDPNGWQYYGEFSEDGEFDYIPSIFVNRLRTQLKSLDCRVKLQEMLVYSQLFVEFVNEKRVVSLRQSAGIAISGWVCEHWKRRKDAKEREMSNLRSSLMSGIHGSNR